MAIGGAGTGAGVPPDEPGVPPLDDELELLDDELLDDIPPVLLESLPLLDEPPPELLLLDDQPSPEDPPLD